MPIKKVMKWADMIHTVIQKHVPNITSSYRDSFNNDCFGEKHNTLLASARAGNVIGGGDYSQDRLIPDFIKSIHEDKDILIRKPNAIRPWQFVLEPLSGYLLLGKKLLEADPHYAAAYNFGRMMKQ